MVPKEHRLSDRHEISHAFRSGKKAYGSLFSFVFLPNALPISRFAVIVSKKIFPRAVDRNRTKRLMRESLRHLLPHIAPGYDGIVTIVKKPIDKLAFKDVSVEVEALLRQSRLLL